MVDSEPLIIKGCIEGRRAAQAKLYDLFSPQMIMICLRYSRNREEAEEIMQEGFYRIFKYIHLFKHMGSFEGWMKRIMINAALQRFKSTASLHPVIALEAADCITCGNNDIHDGLHVKELLRLVQTLPAAYRLVFNLYVFEGYKHREIAEMLGISVGTSKSNLSDARSILQKAIHAKKKLIIS